MSTAVATRTRSNGNGQIHTPTVEIVEVTPTRARKWLQGNVRNRKLRETRVKHVNGILERGEWELTGDAIVFDWDEVLVNGQHRLTSIAETGISASLVVLRGVPPKAQDVMDRGLPRKLSDSLKLRGLTRTFTLASALNWLYRLEYIRQTGNVHYATPGDRPTSPQALVLLDENPDLADFVKYTDPVYKELHIRQGLTTTLYYTFYQINGDEADAFFEQLETGLNFALGKQDPVYHLRRMLIADAAATSRMPDYREAAVICKAWNLWREGKPVQSLAWKYGGKQREDFPIPE